MHIADNKALFYRETRNAAERIEVVVRVHSKYMYAVGAYAKLMKILRCAEAFKDLNIRLIIRLLAYSLQRKINSFSYFSRRLFHARCTHAMH